MHLFLVHPEWLLSIAVFYAVPILIFGGVACFLAKTNLTIGYYGIAVCVFAMVVSDKLTVLNSTSPILTAYVALLFAFAGWLGQTIGNYYRLKPKRPRPWG